MAYFEAKIINAPNSISAVAPPQSLLGAYSAPTPLAGFQGPSSKGGAGGGNRRG